MTFTSVSAPGFAGAMPNQAPATLTGPALLFQPPRNDSATFAPSFRALDSLVVRTMRDQSLGTTRPAPRLGVGTSSQGRATDIDEDKGAPYRERA